MLYQDLLAARAYLQKLIGNRALERGGLLDLLFMQNNEQTAEINRYVEQLKAIEKQLDEMEFNAYRIWFEQNHAHLQ